MSRAHIKLSGIPIGVKSNKKPNQQSINLTAFHALILADFTGSNTSTKMSKPKIIDRDNFDEVLASIQPTLHLQLTDKPEQIISLTFNEIEDFEPDAIIESLDIFSDLRSLKRRLNNPTSFENAAREMNAWVDPNDTPSEPITSPNTSVIDDRSLLDSIISTADTHQQQNNPQYQSNDDLAHTLIQNIIAPHILPAQNPKQDELIKTIDKSISELLKSILHHEDFKALESTWRSVYLCVRQIETNKNLKLYFFNISKSGLDKDDFYQQAIEPYISVAGATPWSLIIGDYHFSNSQDDIKTLEAIGSIAQQCNATFISSASSTVVGYENPEKILNIDDGKGANSKDAATWNTFRDLPQTAHIGLCFPRTLLRIPYGKKTKPIENFDFEEMETSEHKSYLWGNSAYHILILMTESFNENNWQFTPGENNEISDLPAHFFEQDGETEMKPCAEIYLNERGAEQLIQHGLLPIWSILRSNAARVGPFFSVNKNNSRIMGRWNSTVD